MYRARGSLSILTNFLVFCESSLWILSVYQTCLIGFLPFDRRNPASAWILKTISPQQYYLNPSFNCLISTFEHSNHEQFPNFRGKCPQEALILSGHRKLGLYPNCNHFSITFLFGPSWNVFFQWNNHKNPTATWVAGASIFPQYSGLLSFHRDYDCEYKRGYRTFWIPVSISCS